MLLHTPSRGRFSAKLSHFWAPEKRENKRKAKGNHYALFVQFPSSGWGPIYWIYNPKLTACARWGTEIQITGRAVTTEGLLLTDWKWETTQAAKRGQALGVIFCSSHLGLGFWGWFLLTFLCSLYRVACTEALSSSAWGSHLGFQFVQVEHTSANLRAASAAPALCPSKQEMKFKPDRSVPPPGDSSL